MADIYRFPATAVLRRNMERCVCRLEPGLEHKGPMGDVARRDGRMNDGVSVGVQNCKPRHLPRPMRELLPGTSHVTIHRRGNGRGWKTLSN